MDAIKRVLTEISDLEDKLRVLHLALDYLERDKAKNQQ